MVMLNEMYPSKFMKAVDVPARGLTLEIERVYQEEVDTETKQKKWTIKFKDEEQLLVINKTNGSTLAQAFGNDTDSWLGKKITLKTVSVPFRGSMTPGIRVSKADGHQVARPDFDDTVDDIRM